MEQTTLSNLPVIIDTQKLAEVQTLPEILILNRELADMATEACTPVLLELQGVNLQTIDVAEMDAKDQQLNDLQVRARAALEKAKSRRDPYTKFFDDIRGMFTAEEKRITDLGLSLKVPRDAWAKEKGRRAAEAEKERQLELQKKQEAIDLKSRIKCSLNVQFTNQVANQVQELHNKFYSVGLDSIGLFEKNIRAYDPAYNEQLFGQLTVSLLTTTRLLDPIQATEIKQEVIDEMFVAFKAEYSATMIAERERIIELIPSRITELQQIAAGNEATRIAAEERQQQEQAAAQKALADHQAAKDNDLLTEKAVDSMNAAFEVASTSGPVISLSSGTKVKKKIVADSHAAWASIMQLWVSKAMPGTDLSTLEKKLGFMKTFAEKWINAGGEELACVKTEDDYSTSARKAS
jgi:hypothetical protein